MENLPFLVLSASMSVPLLLLVQMSSHQEVDTRNLPPYENRAYLKTIEGILNNILFQKYSGHRISPSADNAGESVSGNYR